MTQGALGKNQPSNLRPQLGVRIIGTRINTQKNKDFSNKGVRKWGGGPFLWPQLQAFDSVTK